MVSRDPSKNPVNNFLKSFTYAWTGIADVFLRGRNIKVQSVIAVTILAVALILRVPPVDLAVLVLSCVLVLSLEMINTAIEDLINTMTRKENKVLGKVKDIMAGAVLMAAIGTGVAGVLILGKPVFEVLIKIVSLNR